MPAVNAPDALMEKHDGDVPDRRDRLGCRRDWLRLGRAIGPRLGAVQKQCICAALNRTISDGATGVGSDALVSSLPTQPLAVPSLWVGHPNASAIVSGRAPD